MKYNADYHKNVVDNYKSLFENKYGHECALEDEKIWDYVDEWGRGGDTDEEILEQLKEKQNEN